MTARRTPIGNRFFPLSGFHGERGATFHAAVWTLRLATFNATGVGHGDLENAGRYPSSTSAFWGLKNFVKSRERSDLRRFG